MIVAVEAVECTCVVLCRDYCIHYLSFFINVQTMSWKMKKKVLYMSST